MSKSTLNTGVFERNGSDTMNANNFYIALTLSLIWGLTSTAVIAYYAMSISYAPSWLEMIGLGLVIPIVGIIISIKSDNPIISFIGYNMVCLPFGMILAPMLQQYSPDIIRNAFGLTAVITFLMGMAGTLFPNVFSRIGSALFIALCCLVVVRILQIFIPELDLGIIDYLSAALFSLYIGYDMYRANTVAKTLDNAIDISVQLYLDIINLFLSILRIMGRK